MPHNARLDANTRLGDVEESFGKGEPTTENREKYALVLRNLAERIEKGDVEEISLRDLRRLHTRSAIAVVLDKLSTLKMRRSSLPWVELDSQKCQQCGRCVVSCDYEAIQPVSGGISIDKRLCTKCYKCIEECDEKALSTQWDRVVSAARMVHHLAKNNRTTIVV